MFFPGRPRSLLSEKKIVKQECSSDHDVLVALASLSLLLFPNLLPILIFCMWVHCFHINTVRGDWGFSLETYLQWVGSPSMALHEGSTPPQVLMTKRWSPLFLRSRLGSKSHRHHRSSQMYTRKARAEGDFEALGGRDSRAHLVPRQRGSKHIGISSDTCGLKNKNERSMHRSWQRAWEHGCATVSTAAVHRDGFPIVCYLHCLPIFLLVYANTRIYLLRKQGAAENNTCSKIRKKFESSSITY